MCGQCAGGGHSLPLRRRWKPILVPGGQAGVRKGSGRETAGGGGPWELPLPASAFPVNQDAIPLVRLGTGEKVWDLRPKETRESIRNSFIGKEEHGKLGKPPHAIIYGNSSINWLPSMLAPATI